MKRRALLVAAGALGVGSVGTSAADENDPDCEETTEIVTGRSGDEVTSTEMVPAPWWDQVERVRAVQDELSEEFGDEEWFEATGRSSGSREICGRNVLVVTVYASDVETAREYIDEDSKDVPLSIEERIEDPVWDVEGDVAREGDQERDTDETEGETNNADDEDDPTPGPGVVGALAGVGTAGLLLGKRMGNGPDRT
ncbi:hypothetical protein [Natranaeroarchaeum aerophilus]|uniref:PGF-CTERM sorting domain-containing protein n=1 Tax=Natranaeroarchaeum aerophilus TaxID=2917711 RepID=A0AAE3FPA9_9EURY|nr:hypothetical protein [Natranaeroarchaeum aerophilus]MCL9812754.1 hypothetical protein [Natranaeroarchaeum aerophilus]